MGTFGKSFTREIGKNTGRFVSNKVFGDGHASKHKIIHGRENARSKASEIKAAAEEIKAAAKEMKAEAEYERQQQETLKDKQSMINQITFGSGIEEITHALDKLVVTYKSDNDNDIKSAVRAKAQAGIIKLESLGENKLATHYKKQFPKPGLVGNIFTIVGVSVLVMGIAWMAIAGFNKPRKAKELNTQLEQIEVKIQLLMKDGDSEKALELINQLVHPDHSVWEGKGEGWFNEVYYDEYWDKRRQELKDKILIEDSKN